MKLQNTIAIIAATLLAACAEDDYQDQLTAQQEQAAASDGIVFQTTFDQQTTASGFTDLTTNTTQDITRFDINKGAAGSTTFQQGDLVGIFLVRTGTDLATIKAVADKTYDGTGASPVVLANVPYQYQADGRLLYWDGTQTGKLYWPSDNTYNNGLAAYTTYAYYPYKAGTTIDNITGTVKNIDPTPNLDPTDPTNRIKPLLYSIASTPRLRLNTLNFSHALSILEVTVKPKVWTDMPPNENSSTATGSIYADEGLYFRGLKPNYTFNLFTGDITAQSEAGQNDTVQQIRMYRVSRATATTFTFRTLIPKQDIDFTNFDHLRIYYPDPNNTGQALINGSYLTFGRHVSSPVQLQKGMRHTLAFGSKNEIDDHFRDIDRGGQNMMCEIMPGSFTRNSHTVTLTKYTQMGRTEVTNAQYCQFLNANNIPADGIWSNMPQYMKTNIGAISSGRLTRYPLIASTEGDKNGNTSQLNTNGLSHNGTRWVPVSGKENYPATDVTWYGAKCYCLYYGGDLPTDAEWELACRAGTTTTYYWGASMNGNYCWYSGNSGSTITSRLSHPVAGKTPNARGLYDMSGNVYEWTNDYHNVVTDEPTADVTNPKISGERSDDPTMTVRGGSYLTVASFCTSAIRVGHVSWGRWHDVGFRIMMK